MGSKYIMGAIIGGAILCLFFYALGKRDGRQDAALAAAQAITKAMQNRAEINETINNLDGFALCVELGGLPEQCEQLRGLAENQP